MTKNNPLFPGAPSPSDNEWDEWFDNQHELNERIRLAIKGLSKGHSELYATSLWSSVIEKAAEELRFTLP